jgi:nicotinamide-nucleotide amidase
MSSDNLQLVRVFPEAVLAGDALRRAGLKVAVAESCTGGLLGAALTAVAGASVYVRGGVIAYADDVKSSLLGVPAKLIDEHGAVSEPVAEAMASGARRGLGADVGLGITGVAGPGAEGSDKPPGLIFVAVAGPGEKVRVVRLEGDRGREVNRAAAVREALRLCTAAAGGAAW